MLKVNEQYETFRFFDQAAMKKKHNITVCPKAHSTTFSPSKCSRFVANAQLLGEPSNLLLNRLAL